MNQTRPNWKYVLHCESIQYNMYLPERSYSTFHKIVMLSMLGGTVNKHVRWYSWLSTY